MLNCFNALGREINHTNAEVMILVKFKAPHGGGIFLMKLLQ